ncbi:MAG: hypothetical protein AAGC55_34735 [Myxococcota bacterium]
MNRDRPDNPADPVGEFAAQAVRYVHAAVGMELDYTSDTLPVVDHYLRGVATDQSATLELVIITAGAYFGEVVRRRLGGRWELDHDQPTDWRLVLPCSLSFSPAGTVAAAIASSDDIEQFDARLEVPGKMRPHLEAAMGRMSQVTEEEYYSLCGRLDTMEHLQEVLFAIAAQRLDQLQ